MRRLALLAVLLPLLAAAPAEAKVSCGDGATAFVDGKLRIFGDPLPDAATSGASTSTRASGGGGRWRVGGVGSTTGTGSARRRSTPTPGRFLASYHQSDGEGGPSAHVSVVDLVRRRSVSFVNVACCEWTPALRLGDRRHRGGDRARRGRCSSSRRGGGRARSRARGRATSRCTAGPSTGPRAAGALGGAAPGVGGGEARALEPVRLRRRGGACAAARGRTIVASGSVRVYETRRRALRLPRRRAPSLPARGLDAAADRRRPLAARLRRGQRARARHRARAGP